MDQKDDSGPGRWEWTSWVTVDQEDDSGPGG